MKAQKKGTDARKPEATKGSDESVMKIKYGKLIILGLLTALIVLTLWSNKASAQGSKKRLARDHRIVATPFLEDNKFEITPRKPLKLLKRLKTSRKPEEEVFFPDDVNGGEIRPSIPTHRPYVEPKSDLPIR
jgi:hypothetical protein